MSFQPISKENPLILASNSPRRKTLLQQIGLPFRSLPSDVDENQALGEPPVKAVLLAEKKAKAVYSQSKESWILGADTMVVVGGRILGKPRDHEDIHSMLQFSMVTKSQIDNILNYLVNGHLLRISMY